eukprot:GILI01000161.1.p1 GENE.GILI01000161.1~~GILI01000161.1.p1  ORF type:complete len:166 (+),score=68.26 GILI01000161.1:46-498(+)
MKAAVLLLALFAVSAYAAPHRGTLFTATEMKKALNEILPFTDCGSSAIKISTLSVDPYPCQRGSGCKINLVGTAESDVTLASLDVETKYSGVHLHDDSFPDSRTLAAGPFTYEYSVDIPSIAPAGKYSLKINIKAADASVAGCIAFDFKL